MKFNTSYSNLDTLKLMLLKLCHFKYIGQNERPEPAITVCDCVSLLFTKSV